MTAKGKGIGAYHPYLRFEVNQELPIGTFSRQTMERVEARVFDYVPEAERHEVLAMLFHELSPLTPQVRRDKNRSH